MINTKGSEKAGILLKDALRQNNNEQMGLDLRDINSGSKEQKIKRIAVQFEEMMINTLLKEAFKESGDKDQEEGALGALTGGNKTYKDIRTMFLSQFVADSGGLGYRAQIEEQLRLNYFRDDENVFESIPKDKNNSPLPLNTVKTLNGIPLVLPNAQAPAPPPTSPDTITPPPSTETAAPPAAQTQPPQPPKTPTGPFETVAPVSATVSSGYGWRKDPIDGKTRFHAGMDFAVPPHTPVKSFMQGEVTYSGWQKGYGRIIEVTHPNGYVTRYGHNAQLMVNKGDRVEAGKIIALSGSSGRSTGPHLHFEIRKGNFSLDPARIINHTGGEFLARK